MPDDILISELSNAPQIDDSAVFPFSQDNGGSLATFKASMSDIAGKVAEGTTFVNLQTTSKNLVGAINEVAQGGGGSADIISTASGAIATFNDGGDNIPVKSLVTEIVAVQSGTGIPSPLNVRPITGFDTVVITNKDDIDSPTTTDTHTSTLPETIYGGNAELVGGNGTKTHGYILIDGVSETFTGVWGSNPNGYVVYKTIPDITNRASSISNEFAYQYATWQNMDLYKHGGSSGASTTISFCLPNTVTDLASANAWASNNNIQLVYELATPTTFNTTPEQITTLSGTNNIYSNTGDVEVEYFNENADQMAELIRVMTR